MRVNHEILAKEFERAKGDRNRLQRWWVMCSTFLQAQNGIVDQLRGIIRQFLDLIPAKVENAPPDTWLEWFKAMRRDQEWYLFLREHWPMVVTHTEANQHNVRQVAELEISRILGHPFDVESLDRAIDQHLGGANADAGGDRAAADQAQGPAGISEGEKPQALPADDAPPPA